MIAAVAGPAAVTRWRLAGRSRASSIYEATFIRLRLSHRPNASLFPPGLRSCCEIPLSPTMTMGLSTPQIFR
jgi:hypothetical protein